MTTFSTNGSPLRDYPNPPTTFSTSSKISPDYIDFFIAS